MPRRVSRTVAKRPVLKKHTSADAEPLSTCPFCGVAAEECTEKEMGNGNVRREEFFVRCPNQSGCECCPRTAKFKTAEMAKAAWNRRAVPS